MSAGRHLDMRVEAPSARSIDYGSVTYRGDEDGKGHLEPISVEAMRVREGLKRDLADALSVEQDRTWLELVNAVAALRQQSEAKR